MGKHKHISTHHLYLGAGGVVAVVALVVALTFGLSSAQDHSSGSYTHPPTDSGTYTPPPTTDTYTPPPSCPSGQWWDFSTNTCKSSDSGTYVPPTSGGCITPMPTTACGAGQHYECQSNAWTCKTDSYTNMPPPTTGFCSGTSPLCTGGQYPECTNGAWQCKSPTPDQYPSAQTCPANQMPCQPMNNACSSAEACALVTPVCGPNEYPTPQKACKPSSTMPTQPTTQSDCWNSSSANFASQECTQMRAQVNDAKTMQPQDQGTQQLPTTWQPGQCPQDMISCDDQWMPGSKVCKPTKFWEWDQNTQKSTEKAMTCESWAAHNKEQEEKWKNQGPGTMGGFNTGIMNMGKMGNFGQSSMPFGGQGMQGNWFDMQSKGKDQGFMNPCAMNPDDPFCKGGFDFGAMQDQYKFDESQFGEFMPDQGQWDKKRIKDEVKGLKMDVKNWTRDLKQIQSQLKEISRESSGFACPASVEVNSIAQEYQNAIDTVSALTEASSQEEIQKARALGDFVRGKWEDGELTVVGLQQKLFGGPMDEDGNQNPPGKMQSLDGCRELSNIVRDACSMSKEITREAARMKKSGASEEVTKAFDEVLAGLNLRCTNPLAALPEGVSVNDLFKPFRPDPEVCGFGWGGPGPGFGGGGFPGPMPMNFEEMGPGGPGGFGGFEGGFGGMGGMEGFDPEMMERMKEKFMEFQKGGFPGGFSPFGASVLSAKSMPVEFGDDFEFGPPEGMSEFKEPPEECMPPAQRYLSPHRLMRKLDETRGVMDKQFDGMNVCNMLEMVKDFMGDSEADTMGGPGGPPPQVMKLLKSGEWDKACESGDADKLEKIRKRLFMFGGPGGGPGPKGGKGGFGGMIDIDKLVKDKLKEKLGSLLGLDEDSEVDDETASQMKVLEKRINELQSKLDDAAKTILALNERLSEMTTKLAAVVELNEQATKAVNSIAKLPDETVQKAVTSAISTLTDKVDEAKAVLPAEADKLVDAMFNAVITSPPSSQVVEEIASNLNTIVSYAQSGAKKADLIEKVKDELAEVAVLNAADVGNKVTEGIVASSDTADLSQWYAVPALQAKEHGFIAAELKEIKPAEPETKCAALTRVARIMEKATGEEIDMSDKTLDKPVPGAPDWCLPFISHLQEKDVPFVENLKDPNASIDRGEVAMLIHEAVGDKLPDPPSIADYVTPDIAKLPVDQQVAIAEIRYNGIMDTTDGVNFSPSVDFNRAQNALVSTKAYEAVNAAVENQ